MLSDHGGLTGVSLCLKHCLNPCFNGICSLTSSSSTICCWFFCLNPCFNGICSLTRYEKKDAKTEGCLNPCFNGICSLTLLPSQEGFVPRSLNPCFNGICSLTGSWRRKKSSMQRVLILVLMEYALWPRRRLTAGHSALSVLILVLMEYALWQFFVILWRFSWQQS